MERNNRGIKELDSLELHNVYSALYITQVIKSRRMSGLGQVAREREGEGCVGILSGKLIERIHSEKLIVNLKIILNVGSMNTVRGRWLV